MFQGIILNLLDFQCLDKHSGRWQKSVYNDVSLEANSILLFGQPNKSKDLLFASNFFQKGTYSVNWENIQFLPIQNLHCLVVK